MKTMFRYMFRAKLGILTALCCCGGFLAVSAFAVGMITGMNFWIYTQLEEISILIAVIVFLFVCSHAFRFGTANGVSRSSVIKTLLASDLFISAGLTAVNSCFLVLRYLITLNYTDAEYHWSYDLLYIRFTDDVRAETAAAREMLNAAAPKLLLWESVLYFGIVCLLLTLCCFMYALFRKYGFAGLAGGVMIPLLLYWAGLMFIESSVSRRNRVYNFFFYQEPVQLTQYALTIQPKGLPCTAVFIILILAATTGFAVCMKHTDIRKENG